MGEGQPSAQDLWKKARSGVSPSLDVASGKAGTSIPVSVADDKSIKDELSVAGGDEHVSSDEEPTKNTVAQFAVTQLTSSFGKAADAPTLSYTFAYWIKWKPMETLSDQMLFFGETRNMPALVRGNKLGCLIDNKFSGTDFDPRLAGENWSLLVVTNDGTHSRFWIGYHSQDAKGCPQPARAQDPEASMPATYVRAEMPADVKIRRLVTSTKGAGLIAQAWIWPRDLEDEEIRELWIETKGRYPLWEPGITRYRPPPTTKKPGVGSRGVTPKAGGKRLSSASLLDSLDKKEDAPAEDVLPWEKVPEDPLITKDNAALLDVPLASKLAFQRLKNVFAVLVDYTTYSRSFLVIDRVANPSPTAELMLEVALRASPVNKELVVLVMDSRPRLEKANNMLQELIDCGFLIDQEKAYKEVSKKTGGEEPKLTDYKLTSTDYAGPKADLRRLISPAGLAWLRESGAKLAKTERLIDSSSKHLNMCKKVRTIYREYGYEKDMMPDKRPIIGRIWKIFYDAQLFASGTHYLIFDEVELKARAVISTLGVVGCIFLHGSTDEYHKIVECIQNGSPLLLLESTGGVAQAFSYVVKVVRLMKPRWKIEFVLRLITEYKQRAAKDISMKKRSQMPMRERDFVLENIHLLDKELARIDMLLSAGEHQESWMRSFGLPEVLLLFEIWQRSADFLMKQCQTGDVMKKDAEQLLDLFTRCFSSASSPPELGLGTAEKKVVATAWNRHLILFNNAAMYNKRSWTMQFVLYFLALNTTLLSILVSNYVVFAEGSFIWKFLMLLLPIITALLGTIGTRLRQQQKYAVSKMSGYEILSEIYKFRTRSMQYDPIELAKALKAAQEGPADKKKKNEEDPAAPISAKEKDRLARERFVSTIQEIYSYAMTAELSKGTSVSHKTGGLDPSRLLVEEFGDAENQRRVELQQHVAANVYFITLPEWALTREVVKKMSKERKQQDHEDMKHSIKVVFYGMLQTAALLLISIISVVIFGSLTVYEKFVTVLLRKERSEPAKEEVKAVPGQSAEAAAAQIEKQKVSLTNLAAAKRLVSTMRSGLLRTSNSMAEAAVSTADVEEGDKRPGTELDDDEIPRGEKLDEEHLAQNEGEEVVEVPDDTNSGGAIRIKDDMMTSMSIDEYMDYRARPLCAYVEKTAPWRAFELQCLEVAIFTINASGSVLAALGDSFIPYVALTVSASGIATSFLEFSRLPKQVEAFNQAQREIHNLFNKWDGMTKTARRTRQTITEVVGTVEREMINVAVSLTDAVPSSARAAVGAENEEEEK